MRLLMEGDIDRSHIMTSVRKVHLVALLCLRVANKQAFESLRDKFGEGEGVILDKDNTSKEQG